MSQPISSRTYTQGTGTFSNDLSIAVVSTVNPLSTNANYQVQKRWVNVASGAEFFLAGFTSSNGQILANWIALGVSGGSGIQTLTGNSGGAVSGIGDPSNVNIVGDGTTLNIVGDPSTHTLTASFVGAGGGIKSINQRVFTSNISYVPTSGIVFAVIEVMGAGGSGGSPDDNDSSNIGGGGGSGEYARAILDAMEIGGSQALTIGAGGTSTSGAGTGGAGGDSSFGTLIVAHGGGGGTVGDSTSPAPGGAGGSGGTATLGGFLSSGSNGHLSYLINDIGSGRLLGAAGGSGYFGGGATEVRNSAGSTDGLDATTYGGGGGGSAVTISSATTAKGGDGFAGVIIITEYIG